MTTKLPTYGKYKPSGVEWLGEIPEHWEVTRVKNLIDMITGYPFKSEKYSESGIKLARGINVKEGVLNWDETRYWPQIEKHIENYLLKSGDVLIAMDGSKVGKNFCMVTSEDLPILLLQRVARLRAKQQLLPKILFYNILCRNFLTWVEMTKTDPMVPHISPADINNYVVSIQPLEEQTAIAQFLDRKTALIDQAIGIKQKQIELLKERRQILIHQTVTRGLNPEVKMKDSGVEWIGEVPEGWEVKKLKFLFKLIGGGTPSKERIDFWQGDIPWVSPKDMKTDYISHTEDYMTTKGLLNSSSNLIESNTLLMVVRSGILQRTIPVAISKVNLTLNQDMKAFLPIGSMSTDFMFYFVKGNDRFLKNDWVKQGATVESVEAELLKNSFIPIPPIEEQKQIVSHIEIFSEKIATAITLKQQEIAKLQEYKATLINSAVTGKIKVGSYAQ